MVAAVIALSFSYDLLRMPVQVSDCLGDLLKVQQSSSVYASVVDYLQSANPGYMRPAWIAMDRALLDAADGHYSLTFRGLHALLLATAVLLFTRALRVRTWSDFAAAAFALTVLTGTHTFAGTVREAFPINPFLEIVVCCLVAVNLAQSRGGWWVDLAAVATFAAASLIVESGLLVWVVVMAVRACGLRGISTRGIAAMTALLIAYIGVRLYLSVGLPPMEVRSAGFLLERLEPAELHQRFGASPLWFYAYNVGASVLSVLFAEPQRGVFRFVRAWLDGDVPPRMYIAIASSVLTTALLGWVAAVRLRGRLFGRSPGQWRDGDVWLVTFAAVLVASAVMSFAYTKDEIMSTAGVFYAFAAYAATRYALDSAHRLPGRLPQVALCVVLSAAAVLWAFRSAGLHHALRVQAFKERAVWAQLEETRFWAPGSSRDSPSARLVRQLRSDALALRVPNPYLFPSWQARWWDD
jgi:hypothetical protein